MSTMIYGIVVLAALVSKVAAHPDFYDTRRMGCEIPSTGFAGHGAPEADPAVVMTITKDGAAVTEFAAGEMYDIEMPAYTGTANAWIHASAGEMAGADPTTHPTAIACPEAAHSAQTPAATHMFVWTAPATTDPVTFSAAQATGSSDNYHTATMELPGGGAAAPGAAAEAEGTDTTEAEGTGAEGTEADAPEAVEASGGFVAATGALAAAAAAVAALAM